MGAANKFDFLYSVQQRKDMKCFTLLVYYGSPSDRAPLHAET
jgi:hypothetical protein